MHKAMQHTYTNDLLPIRPLWRNSSIIIYNHNIKVFEQENDVKNDILKI